MKDTTSKDETNLNFSFNSKDLSFTADDKRVYKFCIKNGLPDKLGDGFFGVVYRIKDSEDKEWAFKLFYEKGDTTKERYKKERAVAKQLHKRFQNLSGLIEPVAGTDKFKIDKQAAGKKLEEFFASQGIVISQFGLVLPVYEKTLKGLLEESCFNTNESGYKILETMNFVTRTATILPFLQTIVAGLRKLYSENYTHLDLKPANIFVKEIDPIPGFEAVVADLGFLDISDSKSDSLKSYPRALSDDLPLGTRHYRSPEQKDYFDVCDVEVKVEGNGKLVRLLVHDPKFDDTIIEPGDWVRFSKAPKNIYQISQISLEGKNNEPFKEISFEKSIAGDLILPESNTQVILYKNQRLRTDLFGLGAIAYDMITCGKSPERFYENIKGLDIDTDNRDEGIIYMLENYKRIAKSRSSEPFFHHIFKPFQHQNKQEYAPVELVELILKCMLYKSKETYFHAFKRTIIEKEMQKTAADKEIKNNNDEEQILIGVEAVLNKLIETKFSYAGKNPLILGKPSLANSIDYTLDKTIREVKTMKGSYHVRLFMGIKYLDLLINMIYEKVFKINSTQYFSELLPNNIRVKMDGNNPTHLNFDYSAYGDEKEYILNLEEDSVHVKITGDNQNIYVPNEFVFMRRKISLKSWQEEKLNSTAPNLFKYDFTTPSFSGDLLQKNDWILFSKLSIKEESRRLWRVQFIDYDQRVIGLTSYNNESDSLNVEDRKLIENDDDIIYYRNLDRSAYYLYLLGIYIQQLFFVKIGITNSEQPEYIEHVRYYLRNEPKKIQIQDVNQIISNHDVPDEHKELYRILLTVTSLYAKLTLLDSPNSYYKSFNKEDRIKNLYTDFGELKEQVQNFFKFNSKRYPIALTGMDDDIFKQQTEEYTRLAAKMPENILSYINFNNLLKTIVPVGNIDSTLLSDQLKKSAIENETEEVQPNDLLIIPDSSVEPIKEEKSIKDILSNGVKFLSQVFKVGSVSINSRTIEKKENVNKSKLESISKLKELARNSQDENIVKERSEPVSFQLEEE